jgi:hypothetical protein
MDEQRKWKNVNKQEWSKDYKRKAKEKEPQTSLRRNIFRACYESMEFQRKDLII